MYAQTTKNKEYPMKKYIALLLLTSCLLASCSSAPADETTGDTSADTNESIESIEETETETDTEATQPEIVEPFEYNTLELDRDPVYENGMFVLYFTDDAVTFTEDTIFRIGVMTPGESYTITAENDTASYPDMLANDEYKEYCGIALRPSEEIPAGEYEFSVTFEKYIVNFDLTLD